MSETLYFLNPLSLFNWTTMFAGKPWESQSGDCSSSATAGAGDNNFPKNPPSSPSPPPPPPPKFPLPPPPPPPLLRNDDGRFEIPKRKKDAAEETEATARDFARFLRRRSFGGASVSRLLLHFMDGTRGDGEEIRGRPEEGRDKSFRRVQIEVELEVPGISWPLTEKAAMAWKRRAKIRFQREDAEVSAKAMFGFCASFFTRHFPFGIYRQTSWRFSCMEIARMFTKMIQSRWETRLCMCDRRISLVCLELGTIKVKLVFVKGHNKGKLEFDWYGFLSFSGYLMLYISYNCITVFVMCLIRTSFYNVYISYYYFYNKLLLLLAFSYLKKIKAHTLY